jgi:type VI secretion system protein ImpA
MTQARPLFSAADLLQPIRPDMPSGADMTFSPELDAIAHARKFDDPSLAQGEWVTDLKEANWELVVERSAMLLQHTTKDLRLAVWLTEAAAKQNRLRGLGEGLRVLAGLLDNFWDDGLYPRVEDGDMEQRIGNLGWILARVPTLLREIPITDGNGAAFSQLDLDIARKQNNDDGRALATMEAARRATSVAFRTSFAADAQACLDALHAFERATDRRLGNDAPAFVAAREAVQRIMEMVPRPVAEQEDDGAEEAALAATDGTPAARPAAAPTGPITTRKQALVQLRAIADFFRRTEPHSPVSYFADKAANAGEQDLHTWLRSVVKDSASLAHIEEMLGVPPQEN